MEITPVQAASLLGKSERTIQRWIKLKKLPVCELADGSYRVNTEDLEPFMQHSDESLLVRIEALEQEIEALVRGHEAAPAPMGKEGEEELTDEGAAMSEEKTPYHVAFEPQPEDAHEHLYHVAIGGKLAIRFCERCGKAWVLHNMMAYAWSEVREQLSNQ